jgi:surfeit locus 1 family protein
VSRNRAALLACLPPDRPYCRPTRTAARPYPCRVPTLLAPRFWGAHLLVVAAVAAAVGLGVWQLHVWEAARASEARDLSDAEPLPLAEVMTADSPFPGEYLGQPVYFRGEWIPQSTLYVADRDLGGRRGYWVVTPVLVGDSAMPVVRGWSAQAQAPAPEGQAEVEGWLQASEGTGRSDEDPHDDVIPEMRIASIVQHVDADLYSGYVVDRMPTESLTAVTAESVPRVSNSTSLRNLLYAFQWWVFGGLAVYIWVRWCRDTWEQTVEEERVASSA